MTDTVGTSYTARLGTFFGDIYKVDFQLVEDCLESAILSRMIELPKTEVVGKFERAKRFVNKLNNLQQKIRIHYQLAWTYLNWYDDYKKFYEEFIEFRSLVNQETNLNNLELYLNLYNLLKTISNIKEVNSIEIDFDNDEKEFIELLKKCSENQNKPSTALLSKFYLSIINISKQLRDEAKISKELINLKTYFEIGKNHLDIPFEQLKEIIEIYGELLPNNKEFDNLIDVIAELEATRVSELSSGKIYLNRGITKLKNDFNRESLVFFGKAVRKLAKDETQDEFYFCLMLLSDAYSKLGLHWAANNCLISAINIYINEWFTTGSINRRFYRSVAQILRNEIIIGRIPVLLTWYELFNVLKNYFQTENHLEDGEMPIENLIDGCLSTRLLNTNFENFSELSDLPDILNQNELWLSADSILFLLGHQDLIEVNESKNPSYTKDKFKEFFNKLANQPFLEQIAFDTNFLSHEEITFYTKILGIKFSIITKDDVELFMLSETILAYLESYMATSLEEAFPISEKITLKINYATLDDVFKINSADKKLFDVLVKQDYQYESKDIPKLMDELIPLIIGNNYLFKDYKKFFENLYKNDEVHERLALIIEHKNFLTNTLTTKPKFFLKDWKKEQTKNYPLKRSSNPIVIEISESNFQDRSKSNGKPDFNSTTHQNLRAETVIDVHLWDTAKWKAFGFLRLPPPTPFGVLITFENEQAGKKIFENWIKEYGKIDINDKISITIVKGIRKDKPYWYKVLVSKSFDKKEMKEGSFLSLTSRFHRMEPEDSTNLNNLVKSYEYFKKYILIPAHIDKDFNMKPFPELGIVKTKLKTINAWEIGIHDFERVVITEDDNPIIPANIENAPILEVLKEKGIKN